MSSQIWNLLICACVVSATPQGYHPLEQGMKALSSLFPTSSSSSWSSSSSSSSSHSPSPSSSSAPDTEIDYNSLGQYGNIATATVEILPAMSDLFDALTPDAAALRSGDPFDSDRLKSITMAFIPMTRKVLIAMAKAEGRTVKQEVLTRLEEMEKELPSAFDFMANVRRTEFHGIGEDYEYYNKRTPYWDNDGRKVVPEPVSLPVEYDPERFSGSIVNMPGQRPVFVNHPPKQLYT